MNMPGNIAENWEFWKERFSNYITAAELNKKDETTQCALLLHLIGTEGYRIYRTFSFTEEEKNKMDVFKRKFDEHFLPRQNTAFERYKFFTMRQNGQTVEQFITSLRDQSNKCKFEKLKDSLVQSMITCGINSNEIREKLLQSDEITLDETVKVCSAITEAKAQSTQIHTGNNTIAPENVHMVREQREPRRENTEQKQTWRTAVGSSREKQTRRGRSVPRPKYRSTHNWQGATGAKQIFKCRNCGKSHPINQCSAFGKTCSACGGRNHFAQMCRASRGVKSVMASEEKMHPKRGNTRLEQEFQQFAHIESIRINRIGISPTS